LADQSPPLQFGQGAAYVFARDAGHCGNVSLPDLVEDDYTPRVGLSTEMLGKLEQRGATRALTVRKLAAAIASSASRRRDTRVETRSL